ncbi:hypothetical protein [Thermomonas sp.]|uniref:hypothetical protein n=1 Tax=Thermomonas sp. TaxID=1971895 RepID=UPI0035B0FECD
MRAQTILWSTFLLLVAVVSGVLVGRQLYAGALPSMLVWLLNWCICVALLIGINQRVQREGAWCEARR